MTRNVLLSVKPRYAHALLTGTKIAEVRRRFPELPSGTLVFVYSTSPERRVIGTFTIRAIKRLPADRLWAAYPGRLKLTRQEVRDYLRGVPEGIAIETQSVEQWGTPVTLAELRLRSGLDVPQSWRYLSDEQADSIRGFSNAFFDELAHFGSDPVFDEHPVELRELELAG